MKKLLLSMALLAMCFTSCKKEEKTTTETETTTTSTDSVAKTEEAPEAPRDSVAEMKAWEAYMTPGDAHKMLAAENGTWSNEMTFWHDANAQPEKAMSTSVSKMILGGRYQETNYTGEMMGMQFEGRSTVAYDNAIKQYVSTWIDNMGTGMMVMKGVMAEDGKSIEFNGEMVDPVTGKAEMCRELYTIVDDKTRKMEMFSGSGEKQFKAMEIVMKKK
ncbi:DUF1579 domain-containing protein [Flavobacterium sp. MFBS3-15]|uniref:DUF1579 domain-containing protein n=1 Tax=Flavobacterium sp. MFBS3-15 TaxID=2989816 RepID=UPI002235B9A5|nr:DUF1579 domain-containing protein [Flavobacterium sp. MFBS3-15]MCW4470895.1 DUF1579 domain-containing protein [Flavobacterium sp. MFBS3-15]